MLLNVWNADFLIAWRLFSLFSAYTLFDYDVETTYLILVFLDASSLVLYGDAVVWALFVSIYLLSHLFFFCAVASCAHFLPTCIASPLLLLWVRLASVRSSSMRVIGVVVCFFRFPLLGVCFWSVFTLSLVARWDMLLPLLFRCVASLLASCFFCCPVLARGW